jgi:FlaG/FlaF family flagellin (archaellin)
MVAIIVITAAVIAAFVSGMAGTISKERVVAFSVSRNPANWFVVTTMGGPDVKYPDRLG